MKEAVTGEYAGPIDYNTAWTNPSAVSSTIRGTVAQNIADSTGVISLDDDEHPILGRLLNGKSLGDVYQLGMSMVDSAAVAALSPIIGSWGTALLGGSAATQGVLDAVANGATDEQALTLGVLNGAFEMLFEKVSLENLLKGNTRGIVRTVLQQGLVEGSEELSTSFANNIADILVMAEHSDYRQNIQAYMDAGLSEEEATKEALKDAAIQMGWDFVGGVLSGGIMGGGAGVINTAQQNSSMRAIYGQDLTALIDEALEIDPSNELAQKLKAKLDNSRRISGGQIYNLVQQNEAGMSAQDVANIQSRAMERLNQLGETGDVHAISAALAKQAAGQKLTRQEQTVISASKYGRRVANELQPDSIRSGDYTSRWTRDIGTERINVAEYNRPVTDTNVGRIADDDANPQSARKSAETATATQQQTPPASHEMTQNGSQGDRRGTYDIVHSLAEEFGVKPSSISIVAEQSTGRIDEKAFTESMRSVLAFTQETTLSREEAIASLQKNVTTLNAQQISAAVDFGWDLRNAVSAEKQRAYDMGFAGQDIGDVLDSKLLSHLTEAQRREAFNEGAKVAKEAVVSGEKALPKTASVAYRKGSVRFDGDAKAISSKFKMTQRSAYIILERIAQLTGMDIVLFASKTDAYGNFIEEQGKFNSANPNEIRIDVNAGLNNVNDMGSLANYVMLRTFTHEFVHSIEVNAPAQYRALKEAVFAEIRRNGKENVENLILIEQEKGGKNEDGSYNLSYDDASHEVLAQSLVDVLPRAPSSKPLPHSTATSLRNCMPPSNGSCAPSVIVLSR